MEAANSARLAAWCQRLFFVNAGLWLSLGSLSLAQAVRQQEAARWVYSLLMLGNAAVMWFFAVRMGAENRRTYLLASAYLVLNLLSLFFDQFGLVDLSVALVQAVLLVLVILAWRRLPPVREGIRLS